jgi:hypothetical protein
MTRLLQPFALCNLGNPKWGCARLSTPLPTPFPLGSVKELGELAPANGPIYYEYGIATLRLAEVWTPGALAVVRACPVPGWLASRECLNRSAFPVACSRRAFLRALPRPLALPHPSSRMVFAASRCIACLPIFGLCRGDSLPRRKTRTCLETL